MRIDVKDATTRTQIICDDCGRKIAVPFVHLKMEGRHYDVCRICVKDRVWLSRNAKPFRSVTDADQ